MKTETLSQAIEFALNIPNVKLGISRLEAHPERFIIQSLSAAVMDYHTSIIKVLVNFAEKPGNGNILEDAEVIIRGSDLTNFEVINIKGIEI
jgi:hypothetical protein